MYVVVEFTAEKTLAAVPKTWINNNQCYWPKKSTGKKIKRAVPPESDWMLYDVKIYREYGTLKEAEDNVEQRRFESSASEADFPIVNFTGTGTDLIEDGENNHNFEDNRTDDIQDVTSVQEDVGASSNEVILNCIEPTNILKGIEDIKSSLAVIMDMLSNLDSRIQKIESRQNSSEELPALLGQGEFELPKSTEYDVAQLDIQLGDNPMMKRDLMKYFSRKGGKTVLEALENMMSSLMVDNIGWLYSFAGARGKTAFNKLKNLCQVMEGALQMNPLTRESATETQFISDMQKAFKHVHDRVNQRRRNALLKAASVTTSS